MHSGTCLNVRFLTRDHQNLPFSPSTFDAAYAIEATVHAPSLTAVYAGIRRVLKPNAVFGLSEWVMNPSYDPTKPTHLGIRNRIERGNAISNLQTSDQCRQAIRDAGFVIEHDEDYSQRWTSLGKNPHRPSIPGHPHLSPGTPSAPAPSDVHPGASFARPNDHDIPTHRPWYYPLAGMTSHAATWTDYWITVRMTHWARQLCFVVISVLEFLRLYPRGTCEAMTTMAYCVDSVVEGGREGIFTPCWWFIGRNVGALTD